MKLIPTTFLLLSILIWSASFSQSPKEGLRKINGTQLFISEEGKGEPLIVLHGGPGLNHQYFKPHLAPLAEKMNVVYYDQRACGESSIPSTDSLSLSFFVDDIEGIRKSLGVEKVNILAHSWGAILAVNYGLKYPNHVKKMVLSNPVALSLEYQAESMKMLQARTTKQDSIDRATILNSDSYKNHEIAATEKLIRSFFLPSFYDQSKITRLNLSLTSDYHTATTALYKGLGPDLKSYNYYESIAAFSFPVLVIAGEADNIPMKAIERIQQNVSNSQVIILDRSGHFPFIEEPSTFNQTVLKFLKE